MKTVLVVEDTELLRRIYADRLTADGYDVVTAADGLEALAALRAGSIDLILLDLVLPRLSGIEVLETVQKDPRLRDTPVIVLSNLGQDEDVERCMALGAVDYLVKNDSRPADVSERIGRVLNATAGDEVDTSALRVYLRDREGDAEKLVAREKLQRRFWCPACEDELQLELSPQPHRPGWYEAHLLCPRCSRDF